MNRKVGLRFILMLLAVTLMISSGISPSMAANIRAQNPSQDSDQDGIPDSQDRCPQAYWPGSGNGCPDTDGDGVDDGNDVCPFEAWSTPNGCQPDGDGDGVPDVNDQCPNQPGSSQNNGCPSAEQPTNTPFPQIQLPTTGVCVITPAGGSSVNVRGDRSTDAAIVAQLIPGQIYFPSALVEGWYLVPDPGGWVREDVVLHGGDCSELPTSDPQSAPGTDFTPDFANCGDIAAEVGRVPVSELLRFINSGDPCGGLTNYLRDRAFNPPNPPAPGAQAMSAQAQCSSDSRPFPSPEALRYLDTLNQIEPELTAQVMISVAAAVGAEPGSIGDQLICALMRGDGFTVGAIVRRNSNELGAYWSAMCVPPIEAQQITRLYNTGGFRPLPDSDVSLAPGLIPAEEALIFAMTSPGATLIARTQTWCSLLNTLLPPPPPTPEQQAVLDWLRQCVGVSDAELTQLVRLLSSGGVDTTLGFYDVRVRFTWADLIEFISRYNGCPQDGRNEFLAFLLAHSVPRERGLGILPSLPGSLDPNIVLGGIIPVSRDPVPMSINVTVFDDQCDRASWDGSPDNLPPNCVSYPAFSGGIDVAADGVQMPPEPGVAGVVVDLHQGSCGGGEIIDTQVTNASGQASFNLQPLSLEQRYCVTVDSTQGPNPAALGAGRWSTVSGPTIYYGFTGGYGGAISTAFPWYWHANDTEAQPPSQFDILPGMLPDMPGGEGGPTPTETPVGSEGTDPGVYIATFNMIVFDDHCDPTGWTGDFRSLPEGCATWAPTTLRANGVVDPGEAGIPGVTMDIYEGSCSAASPALIGVVTTRGDGRIVSEVPIAFRPGDYCMVIDSAAHGNGGALLPGMWSATGTQVIRIPITLDRDLTLTTTIGWWRTGSGMAMAELPPGVGDSGGLGGAVPAVPVGRSLCPAGSSCADIPPRTEPIPDVRDLFPEIDPAALTLIADALDAFGDRFGGSHGSGVFLGRPDSNTSWNLYLYDGGAVYDIGGASDREEAPSISPDGRFAAYLQWDGDGRAWLMIQDVDSGAAFPAFGDLPGMRLMSSPPLWSGEGQTLLITLEDENGVPSLYDLRLDDLHAVPERVLENAHDPAFTGDGALMAFIRDGNVFIRFNATGDERQITQNPDGTVCDTPLFDGAGVSLYFNCAQNGVPGLFVQGFDGLQTITPENGLVLFRCDIFVDGVSVFSDGGSLFFGADDATGLIPLVQIDGLQVTDIRWAR
ncbi:MAG: thrombospondin type 3 repeat-containing protein [Anaerolineae bacterium]